jgi:hypothetical protein
MFARIIVENRFLGFDAADWTAIFGGLALGGSLALLVWACTMPVKKTNLLVEILQGYPSGLTAKDVADRLGADRRNIGSQLSKLAAYGIIKSTRGRIASDASPCAIYFAQPARRPTIQNSWHV